MAGTTRGPVRWDVQDGVAHVRLHRPERMNALDQEMLEELVAVGSALRDLPPDQLGAVVLSGEGRAFCAGLDVSQLDRMAAEDPGESLVSAEATIAGADALGQQAALVWSVVPAPVIASIKGVAYGGGLQIALGADLRIAAPTARLSVMEVVWGLVPDMAGTRLLPGLVARDVALDLALTGRVVDGVEARAMGLVTRLHEDPDAHALDLAAEIAGRSRGATRGVKRLLGVQASAGGGTWEEGLRAEQEVIGSLIGGAEQQAAVARRLAELERRSQKAPPA